MTKDRINGVSVATGKTGMAVHSSDPGNTAARPRRMRMRSSWLAIGLLMAALGALAGVVAALAMLRTPAPPLLTREALGAAMDRWRQNGPADYSLTVAVHGKEPAVIELTVRQGKVESMKLDGLVPRRRMSGEYWTVPGQFDVIGQEMDNQQNPEKTFGVADPSLVVLRTEFDPRLGYPKRYQRELLGGRGELSWEVTELKVLEPPK
ncbi:MAG: hypothetical protein HYS13_18535 [Planctomycetia bacterium]|nr:hypothetical protein [Planctomycetia bacterium]